MSEQIKRKPSRQEYIPQDKKTTSNQGDHIYGTVNIRPDSGGASTKKIPFNPNPGWFGQHRSFGPTTGGAANTLGHRELTSLVGRIAGKKS